MSLQQLLDSTPANGLAIVSGVHELKPGESFKVRRPMTIRWEPGAVVRLVGGFPTTHGFDCSAVTAGRIEFVSPVIDAPASAGPLAGQGGVGAAIGWVIAKTPDTQLVVDNAHITGAWNAAVMRSGGGLVDIRRSTLEAWSAPIKVFESHKFGSGHRCVVTDCVLRPETGGGTFDSIGVYIHPHISTTMVNVTGERFGRWVVYANGTMDGDGRWDLTNVRAVDCSLIQSADGAGLTTLLRCSEAGTQRNGGSLINGSVLSVESTWDGSNGLNLTPATNRLTLVNDTLTRNSGFAVVAGRAVKANVLMSGCKVNISGSGRIVLVNGTADPSISVAMAGCTLNIDPNCKWRNEVIKIYQGTFTADGDTPGVVVVEPAKWVKYGL